MSRIPAIPAEKAGDDLKPIYEDLKKHMGGKVLNIFQVMGNSPHALKGFLALSGAGNFSTLSPRIREEIALVVGQVDDCEYCLSAHTLGASKFGANPQQIIEARKGESSDPKTKAILQFAKSVVVKRGKVTDKEIADLKAAGITDKELVDIILLVVVNIFTNYFNLIVGTDLDLPAAPKL